MVGPALSGLFAKVAKVSVDLRVRCRAPSIGVVLGPVSRRGTKVSAHVELVNVTKTRASD